MRQIVNVTQMKQLDQLTIKKQNITSYKLMERAGTNAEKEMFSNALCDYSKLFVVIAGPGNNGGDALVVMRRLLERGAQAVLIQAFDLDKATSEMKQAYNDLLKLKPTVQKLADDFDLENIEQWLEYAGTVIDGLFGIGLKRDVLGLYEKLIQKINDSLCKVISIDIPSGINADNGLCMNIAIEANYTLVIHNLKQGHLLQDGPDYVGKLHIVDCDINQYTFSCNQSILDDLYMIGKIPPRKKNTHKYHYGYLAVFGGSRGMMGAPILAAKAAYKCGTGLVSILHQEEYWKDALLIDPAILYNHFTNIDEIPLLIKKASAFIFGIGLNKDDELNVEVLKYLLATKKPIVIDASGILFLKKIVSNYTDLSQVIITPHFGEMAELLDISVNKLKENPILHSQSIVKKYNLTLVLKGYTTLIINKNNILFSNHGTPSLAKAGSGDVLSGIIGSLLSRRFPLLEAAKLGVLIHSKTAWLVESKQGEESVGPLDLINTIPETLQFIRR